jgi:4-alpha-glucanotransferase
MSSDRETLRLAKAAGILVDWQDQLGRPRRASIETLRALLDVLGKAGAPNPSSIPALITTTAGESFRLPVDMRDASRAWLTLEGNPLATRLVTKADAKGLIARAPQEPGYHRLAMGRREFTLAVAPRRAARSAAAAPRRWGLTAQLYSLYRPGDCGIAGYTALRDLVASSAASGASALAVSPLHAQFSADLHRFSPYAPSSRLWLNVLHIDPDAAAAMLGIAADHIPGRRRDDAPLVDWPGDSRRRLDRLRMLYRQARDAGALQVDGPAGRDFQRFRRSGGTELVAHAVFEACHARFYGHDRTLWHWRDWPAQFRNPGAAGIKRLARESEDEVAFHMFLQWLAARQFREAARAAVDGGMDIGIIKDIAVGADGGGSEAWSDPDRMLTGASIGSPPDAFNTLGQKWGVTTFSPAGIAAQGFQAFIALLRRSLADAGGVRIDHILGLQRLWIVPDQAGPAEGAYIRYPLPDLLRLVALEAHRAGAIILGEDLGTVPAGFRERLAAFDIRGMQVLWFERDGRRFLAPAKWRKSAVAMTTTHDLPTVAGWWMGKDIAWRRRLKLFATPGAAVGAQAERDRDRRLLWQAFTREGVAEGPMPAANQPTKVIAAAISYLGRTKCELALLPLEDALGRKEQPNLPGTTDQHPNWRRRILVPAGTICEQRQVAQRLRLLAENRGR